MFADLIEKKAVTHHLHDEKTHRVRNHKLARHRLLALVLRVVTNADHQGHIVQVLELEAGAGEPIKTTVTISYKEMWKDGL